jgi:hypothetical protein
MNACRNPAHAGQDGACAGCARAAEAELTALGDRYQRLLNDRSSWEKSVRAAARREAQDHMRAFASLYLGPLMEQLTFPVRPALYRATQLDPSRARTAAERSQQEQLRNAAQAALAAWDERTGRDQAAAAFAADPGEAEIRRFRTLITATGQRLHREWAGPSTATGPGGRCSCPGCDLIRDMDTEGLPAPHECRPGCEHDPGDGHSPLTGIARNE